MQIKKSLTPNPSPNGEGSENYYLQIKESLSPVPSPNGEGSENHCLQMKESLSPVPSPNGEGSENYYLQMKESLSPNPSPFGEGAGVRLVVPLSKPITPLEETNLLEFFLHTCFLFIGHVLEGNTVRSEVETEQFHDALTAYDVTTEVTDNIDHCL